MDAIKLTTIHQGQSETIYRVEPGSKKMISEMSWSPDGNTLAFVIAAPENNYRVSRLFLIDVDGSNFRQVRGDLQMASNPQWILEGDWLAVQIGSGLDFHLKFVRADGKCVLSPFEEVNDLLAFEIANDGSTAVASLGASLYRVNLQSALAPRSLSDILICPE